MRTEAAHGQFLPHLHPSDPQQKARVHKDYKSGREEICIENQKRKSGGGGAATPSERMDNQHF